MSLGSILKSIGGFFARLFSSIKKDADVVAIVITQYLKLAVESGIMKAITDLIPGELDDKIVEWLKTALPKILAIELGLQGLPDDATPEQIQEFILSIEKAVGGKDWQEKSEFWTKFAVKLYSNIQVELNKDPEHNDLSFAQIVKIVEDAYEAYLAHKADEANQ